MASGVLSTWVNIKYIPWNNFGGLEVEDPVIKECRTESHRTKSHRTKSHRTESHRTESHRTKSVIIYNRTSANEYGSNKPK
jgi:hypothetical protein